MAIPTRETWLPDLARSGQAKYQAIVEAVTGAIGRGELRVGDRLPPQRELAAALGVDLTTVTKAYDAIRHQGLIEARGRAGSFVRDPAAGVPVERAFADTGMNMPPEIGSGLLRKAMAETGAALLAAAGTTRLHYQPAGGSPQDRAAGAVWLSGIGLASSEEQVIVTAGGQNALHGILAATCVPGDVVACGRFVYSGFKALAARLGLTLLPLAEMSAAALEAACRGAHVKALYVVPTNDNPTAVTLDADGRAAIAEVARRYDLQVIEDDAYGALAEEVIAPIASLAPERCWYVSSMSKIVSPALRVAYVRTPGVGDALRLAGDSHETAIMAPPLNAAMVTAWLSDGSFARLLAGMRAETRWRMALAEDVLAGLAYARHPQGYHLWMPLPEGMGAAELVEDMRPTGLAVVAGERFAVAAGAEQAVRVSLGGAMDADALGRGLRVLRGYLDGPVRRGSPLV